MQVLLQADRGFLAGEKVFIERLFRCLDMAGRTEAMLQRPRKEVGPPSASRQQHLRLCTSLQRQLRVLQERNEQLRGVSV
jgi:hypothetical protein